MPNTVASGRSSAFTEVSLSGGVCGVSGGVGGTTSFDTDSSNGSNIDGCCFTVGDVGVCGGGGAGPFFIAEALADPPATATFLCSIPTAGSECTSPVGRAEGDASETTSLGTGITGVGTFTTPPLIFDEEEDVLIVCCGETSPPAGDTAVAGTIAGVGCDFLISVLVSTLTGVFSSGTGPGGPAAPTGIGIGPIFVLLGSSSVVGMGVDSFESLDDFDRDVGVSGSFSVS